MGDIRRKPDGDDEPNEELDEEEEEDGEETLELMIGAFCVRPTGRWARKNDPPSIGNRGDGTGCARGIPAARQAPDRRQADNQQVPNRPQTGGRSSVACAQQWMSSPGIVTQCTYSLVILTAVHQERRAAPPSLIRSSN
jgi:hypothetical protein